MTQNTYYLCNLKDKNIIHANFLTTDDCHTDENISWLSTRMFENCGTIKKVDDGKIATSVDGYLLRRGKDYGMRNSEGENLNKFKGYVYQMKAECNSTDKIVDFVVTTKALPYLRKHKLRCKTHLDYQSTYLWKISNVSLDILEADCDETLAIFDSDDDGKTMKLYLRGAFETDVPAKEPDGQLYMRNKGQLFVWSEDGNLIDDDERDTKIEFFPIPVSF